MKNEVEIFEISTGRHVNTLFSRLAFIFEVKKPTNLGALVTQLQSTRHVRM